MKKKDEVVNTNAWMTTYTDLMTLLLTFFVLLLTMSVVVDEKRLIALNSLTGAFGFKPGGHSIIGSPKGVNITIGSSPMKDEVVAFERMRNLILKNSLEKEAEIIKQGERVVLSLGNKVLFRQGESEITPSIYPFLDDLCKVIREGEAMIELRGYCAMSETAMSSNPVRTAMVLSTKRAFATFRFLEERHGIPAERLVAHGFGSEAVQGSQQKEINERSRQVEIILDYRTPVPYRLRKPKGESVLDFKGFLFRIPGETGENE